MPKNGSSSTHKTMTASNRSLLLSTWCFPVLTLLTFIFLSMLTITDAFVPTQAHHLHHHLPKRLSFNRKATPSPLPTTTTSNSNTPYICSTFSPLPVIPATPMPPAPTTPPAYITADSLLSIHPSTITFSSPKVNPSLSSSANDVSSLSGPSFIKMFRGSSVYIARHRSSVMVLHIPGELISPFDNEDYNTFDQSTTITHQSSREETVLGRVMNDVALCNLLGVKIVLVLGVRPMVDERLRRRRRVEDNLLKKTPTDDANAPSSSMLDNENLNYTNLKPTSKETLRVIKEEAGFARFEVERQLARALVDCGRNVQNGHSSGTAGGDDNHSDYYGKATKTPDSQQSPFSTEPPPLPPTNIISGNFYTAKPLGIRSGISYGYTGLPRKLDCGKIHDILGKGDIVLVSCLGSSRGGEMYDVCSESLAAFVAGGVGASKVVYYTASEPKLVGKGDGKIIQSLRLSDAKRLLEWEGVNGNGWDVNVPYFEKRQSEDQHGDKDEKDVMPVYKVEALVKLAHCTHALTLGVNRAHLIPPTDGSLLQELFTRDGSGTLISRDLYDGIRLAGEEDISGILEIVRPLVTGGNLIERKREEVERDVLNGGYHVFVRDRMIIGIAQLKFFPPSGSDDSGSDSVGGEGWTAEIGCLVIHHDYRRSGRGDTMLGYLERLCLQKSIMDIFVMSTLTMDWFLERGFKAGRVENLPEGKKRTVDYGRGSRVYVKRLAGMRDIEKEELMWS